MYSAGRSYDMPSRPSTTCGCDIPTPSVSRPPSAACAVSASAANAEGCRSTAGHERGSDLDPWRVTRGHRHRDEWVEPDRLVGPHDGKAVDLGLTDALHDDIE